MFNENNKILSSFIYYSGNIWCIFEIHHLLSPVYLTVCFAGKRHVIQAGLGILPELRTAG
jgi:hypothetical protein